MLHSIKNYRPHFVIANALLRNNAMLPYFVTMLAMGFDYLYFFFAEKVGITYLFRFFFFRILWKLTKMILFYFKFENNLFPQTNVNLKLMMETNDPFPNRYLNKLRRKKNFKSHCLKCFSSSNQHAETKVVKLRFSLHF